MGATQSNVSRDADIFILENGKNPLIYTVSLLHLTKSKDNMCANFILLFFLHLMQ